MLRTVLLQYHCSVVLLLHHVVLLCDTQLMRIAEDTARCWWRRWQQRAHLMGDGSAGDHRRMLGSLIVDGGESVGFFLHLVFVTVVEFSLACP